MAKEKTARNGRRKTEIPRGSSRTASWWRWANRTIEEQEELEWKMGVAVSVVSLAVSVTALLTRLLK